MRELTVSFDGFKALDGLDFFMQRGELRFVIGPNGAGKTTLLDVITGKTHPDEGAAWFDGAFNVLRMPEHELVRRGIGRKFQTPSIFRSLTVYENLEVSAGYPDGLGRLLRKDAARQRERIEPVLALIGLRARRATRRPARWRTARSSGWRSACCWCRSQSCCCWTSPSPA